jgi:hypothetical protein
VFIILNNAQRIDPEVLKPKSFSDDDGILECFAQDVDWDSLVKGVDIFLRKLQRILESAIAHWC